MDKKDLIVTTIDSLLDGTISRENAISLFSMLDLDFSNFHVNIYSEPPQKAIFYKNQIHRETVIQYLKRLDKINPSGEVDREYLSALYIICSDGEFRYKCLQYIDLEERGIDFNSCLSEQDFSSGYYPLVKLASNLFNENNSVTPMELIRTLSGEYWDLALQAICLRKFTGPLFEKDL